MKSNSLDILKQQGSGFKVPKGYFNSVEDVVMSELNTEKFPKETGFSVPKGYFDAVEETVVEKMNTEIFPHKKGFTTPKDYFNSVEDAVFAKLGKETKDIETSDVPKDYFDTLEDRVFVRIKEEDANKKQPKVIALGARIRKVWLPVAVAVSLALIFVLNYDTGATDTINDIANAEVDKWIEDDLINLGSYEIAEVFKDTDLVSNETIDEDEELLNYLNGTDVESMLLEN